MLSEIISGFNLSVDQGIAQSLGIEAAFIFNHIIYWLRINADKRDVEKIEGKYWMYETQKEMAEFFGFLDEDKICRGLKKLVESGLIERKCLSKNPFDRTYSYTVTDQRLIKKSLRNPPICGIQAPQSAESETPQSAECIYTIEEQEKTNIKAAAGGNSNDKISDLIYKNTKGEAVSISEKQIFKHFLKLPYATEEIQHAILQVKTSSDFIGNIFKYLEAICLRIHNDKSLKTKELIKKEECDIPDTSNAPKVNFGEYMKKHHNIDLGKK